jgi:hypothetical protein
MEQQLNLDLSKSTALTTENGDQIFTEAVVMRKFSKFLVGTPEDVIVPIKVFINPKTGKIIKELLPPDLRNEYEEISE